MKILIVNGSPAGKNSITLQTMEYLKIFFPEHSYETIDAGQRIKALEKDFSAARDALEAADLIIFCYPVYTFLAPAQLHRFLELIEESGASVAGKFATQVTTSKHFYDTTAHRFIEDRCADLGLKYLRGISQDMDDILTEAGQKDAKAFFRFIMWNIAGAQPETQPVQPAGAQPSAAAEGSQTIRVALVADYAPEDDALISMISRFEESFPGTIEKINLREFPFAGGCLGCFNCAADGKCIYKDGFSDYLREHINSADAVVYAFKIKDHSMGYRFKLYDDRQFCNGHRTVTMGRPVGYLVDGKLSAEENLRTVIEARSQVGGNYLAGVATDETDPGAEIDRLVKTLVYTIKNGYTQPKNFYGVGGLKIFRDLIYQMQGLMREDHRFYKKHGFYDFPQKKKGRLIGMYLVGAMMKNKKLSKKFSMTDGMMMSYGKMIKKAKEEKVRNGD